MPKFAVNDVVRILIRDPFPDSHFPASPDLGTVVDVILTPHEHYSVETLPNTLGMTEYLTDLRPEDLSLHEP
jgi:hypothetical protein